MIGLGHGRREYITACYFVFADRFESEVMRELRATTCHKRLLPLILVPFFCLVPTTSQSILAQSLAAQSDQASDQADSDSRDPARYRAVVGELLEVESEIKKLKDSEIQRDFEEARDTVIAIQAQRKLLRQLEEQWAELSDGDKAALQIDPLLNTSELSQRKMLIDLENSKEKVLQLKAEYLKLSAELGSGHPSILKKAKELSKLQTVVGQQTTALERLGVEVNSSVTRRKLRNAVLRQAELKTKFGNGHPDVVAIESEIKMLQEEIAQAPGFAKPEPTPSINLINANLELQEAEAKFGKGHPVFKTLRRKIDAMEKLTQEEVAQYEPENREVLARKLEARISALQDRIFDEEAKLDSGLEKRAEFRKLHAETSKWVKKRKALAAEIERLAPSGTPTGKLAKPSGHLDQELIARKLLDAIETLESLGKSEQANQIRKVLSELNQR